MLSFFPRGVLDEILNLIESVSEGFPSYSFTSHSQSIGLLCSLLPLTHSIEAFCAGRDIPSRLPQTVILTVFAPLEQSSLGLHCLLRTICPNTRAKIRGGIEDKSKIIFLSSQEKHTL